MLRSTNELLGYRILATDGDMGKVHDFLFDDEAWIIRYLVADTGTWLPGRKVLLVPSVLEEPEWKTHSFPISLTKEKIKNSPELDADRPVSRQHEIELHKYFRWNPYWLGGPAGTGFVPPPPSKPEKEKEQELREKKGDPHLRSIKEVTGYHIQALDGEIGHVEELIMDDSVWTIRYMVVDTRNWLPGKKVLVSPHWIERVSWSDEKVFVDLTRELIKNSPEYDPSAPVNRQYEERLYDYYGRPKYWV